MEGGIVLAMAVGGLLQAAVSVGLFLWGRAVAARQGTRFWRWAAWAPIAALSFAVVGTIVGVVFLVSAFGGVSNADPSMKATILAKSISMAMNCSALLILPSWALYLGSLVVF